MQQPSVIAIDRLAPVRALMASARGFVRRPAAELPVLDEVHPEARSAARVDLGVREVALDDIAGTAVGGPKLRGADFKPVEDARTPGWWIRWERVGEAYDKQLTLPPIEVLELGGRYWVVDGHNRVAMARQRRVAYVDANVTALTHAGGPRAYIVGQELRAVLEAGAIQRAAVSGGRSAAIVRSMADRLGQSSLAPCGC